MEALVETRPELGAWPIRRRLEEGMEVGEREEAVIRDTIWSDEHRRIPQEEFREVIDGQVIAMMHYLDERVDTWWYDFGRTARDWEKVKERLEDVLRTANLERGVRAIWGRMQSQETESAR